MEIEHNYAHVNGTRLYYEVAGLGPSLVLIHGFSLDSRMWDDQFELFARHYRVVRYDARGFGRSDSPDRKSYAHRDDLTALIDHLGMKRPHLCGLSMGAGIALDFALAFPALTGSVVCAATTLGLEGASPEGKALQAEIRAAARTSGAAAATRVWLGSDVFRTTLEKQGVSTRVSQIVGDYSGWHWLNDDPRQARDGPLILGIGRLRVPALFIVGEHDMRAVHDAAETFEREVPKARRVVLPDAGHMSNMEAPGAFNEAVLSFLSEPWVNSK